LLSTKSNIKMFEEVVRSPAIDKASGERNDKGRPEPDVFGSTSSPKMAAQPPGFRNRHLLPALVPRSTRQRPSPAARLPLGIIFYLASITVVATATIGAFFGVGFFLLMGSAEGRIPSAGGTHSSELSPPFFLAPSRFLDRPVATPKPTSVEIGAPGSAAVAALPPVASPQPPLPDRQGTQDKGGGGPPPFISERSTSASQEAPSGVNTPGSDTGEAAAAPPLRPSSPTEPTPSQPAAEAVPESPKLVLSAAEIEELLARGDTFLLRGDITSARSFYERAADAGNGQGAMRMGATFDPSFLGRAGLGSARGDPAEARSWYRRGIDLNKAEIKQPPDALETK
jgi:hypothetical protein